MPFSLPYCARREVYFTYFEQELNLFFGGLASAWRMKADYKMVSFFHGF